MWKRRNSLSAMRSVENGTYPRSEPSRTRLVLPILNEVFDHSGISQRRDITEIGEVVLGYLAQDATHDFTRAGLGQAGRELNQIGRSDRADLLTHPIAQLDLESVGAVLSSV